VLKIPSHATPKKAQFEKGEKTEHPNKYTCWDSFGPFKHKTNFISTLANNRALKLCSESKLYELECIKAIICINSYPDITPSSIAKKIVPFQEQMKNHKMLCLYANFPGSGISKISLAIKKC